MIEGFDKEIDFLLRQTAQGEFVFATENPKSKIQNPKSAHLDPDEISALAENALPEKIRQSYILHLADCGRCRKSLSVLVALNREAESGNVFAEQTLTAEIIAPTIPWYRRFFAAPGLAYAMGALILVFAGVGIFTVLQNDNSQVSQISEKQTGGKGMSSDGDAATQEIYSNSMSSNTAAAASNLSAVNMMANAANSAMPAAPTAATSSNAAMMRREPEQVLKERLKDDSVGKPNRSADSEMPVAAAPPPPPTTSENNFELDGRADKQSPNLSQNSGTLNQTQIMPDSRNVQRAPMPAAKEPGQEEKSDKTKLAAVRKKSAESTNVGGKTFNRGNNVWTDAEYRGQAAKNITRGTKEYKKLDAGLRGIVENLGGTVVVVWKDKAFGIQ